MNCTSKQDAAFFVNLARHFTSKYYIGMKRIAYFVSLITLLSSQTVPVVASTIAPVQITQAIVWIACGDRQGTGSIINGDQGYILTNAHVAINIATQTPAKSCIIAFTDASSTSPTIAYRATVEQFIFNQARNQDFAILKIGAPMGNRTILKPFPSIKTNEFPAIGLPIQLFGYSDRTSNTLVTRSGKITGFQGGWIETDAPIFPGDSGGAVLDDNFALIGLPTATLTVSSGTEVIAETSQIVDMRAIINWLDQLGRDAHDSYVTHIDYPRYHQTAVYLSQESLGCQDLVRTPKNPAVYCVILGTRTVFPNAATYFSWFTDFSQVKIIDPTSLANLPISRNVTFKPGTLVKSASAPTVFLVIDYYGTLRAIPSETRAMQLFGETWNTVIHDIPDEFFSNYSIGQPLDS